MAEDKIRYDLRAQNALRYVIRDVLAEVAQSGLPGEHHFYIAFSTTADGVGMSPRLKEQHPEEMTIVLQHQFWDFKVSDSGFEVSLSFNNVPEHLKIPFHAIKSFFDPSVQFGLQFEPRGPQPDAGPEAVAAPAAKVEKLEKTEKTESEKPKSATAKSASQGGDAAQEGGDAPGESDVEKDASAEIVQLDTFRKKS